MTKQSEREAASSVTRVKQQGQKQTRLKRAHRKRENSMINIKTEKGNSQVGMSSYAKFKGDHKEKTCTENPKTNTSAESDTSDAAKEKHSH